MSAGFGELEQALARVGDDVAFPETPDLAGQVAARLAAPRRDPRPWRRSLVVVLAVLAVGLGAAMAVPAARTAILELLGLRGASVVRVETLPAVSAPTLTPLELGREVPLEDGRPLVDWPQVLVPRDLGPPAAAYLSDAVPGGRLTLVYGPGPGLPRSSPTGVGLLVTELRGVVPRSYVEKFAAAGTVVRRLSAEGRPAIWLEGGPHVVFFRSADGTVGEDVSRLAGNTLLVQRDGLLVRIEGAIGLERATEIAGSLEPGRP
ncbi:MAG TPA: hypothetical protein VK915_04510 [Gaiellaceae bacterium]|nr:hypothetical protein [Gaiellaceae bacterium]